MKVLLLTTAFLNAMCVASVRDTPAPHVQKFLSYALKQAPGEGISKFEKEVQSLDDFLVAPKNLSCKTFPKALSNVFDCGQSEQVNNGVRAKINFVSFTTMVSDWDGLKPVAVDATGVVQVDSGRKYLAVSPLFFYKGAEFLPALTWQVHHIEDLKIEGCSLANPPVSKGGFLRVRQCDGGSIHALKIFDKASEELVARPMTKDQMVPLDVDRSAVDLGAPLVELFGDVTIPPFQVSEEGQICTEVIFFGRVCIPLSFTVDVGDMLQDAVGSVVAAVMDALANAILHEDFGEDHPASQATLDEVYQAMLSFSVFRLLDSAVKLSEQKQPLLSIEGLYGTMVIDKPDVTPLPEIISGGTLATVAGAAFGWYLGSSDTKALYLSCAAAAAAFAAELTAFTYRFLNWEELQNWSKKLLVMVKHEVDPAGNFLPLSNSPDGNAAVITVLQAELTPEETNYTGLFSAAAGAIVVGFTAALVLGLLQHREKHNAAQRADREEEDSPDFRPSEIEMVVEAVAVPM